uniref:DEAD-box ATP-dependent RNA helicase 33 n=1 Tax=Davidia involucrata TaxID=16924 RepID=A0A5B7BBR9_DAVIN
MSILQMSLSIPTPPSRNLSSSRVLSGSNHLFLVSKLSRLSINSPKTTTTIRMGGGPRTYPGGVSKWQWKRMQAKKAKQLLKARLTRERQIYEMRKRAELRAAVSELERPWEIVERAPTLFSVSADEQLKVLADRFQQPGGFDLWSEKDGPQLFDTVDGVPSARFFPKGVVHSIKPYGKIQSNLDGINELSLPGSVSEPEIGTQRDGYKISRGLSGGSCSEGEVEPRNSMESRRGRSGKGSNGKFRKKRNIRRFGLQNSSNSNGLDSGDVGFDRDQRVETPLVHTGDSQFSKGGHSWKLKDTNSGVHDMSLQQDGSYGIQVEN